ncbi:uncharacterized protein LOC131073574 [Cryptomeria japonica]|uniref:uncharacterized protein LOC131073574 n=1 Tax=Cryptomeria japonica TaxID=3369 RepID=UPI0027DA1E34|nr:uncharacterized protein LOC131073574 [Cryptomeria japonica]
MSALEGLATNRDPLFEGSNFSFWSVQMKNYFMSLGFDVWMSVVNGYTVPSQPPTDADGKEFASIAKAINAISCGLSEPKFVKVMHCETTHTMWQKLQNSYEGDGKSKNAKLQTHKIQFQSLGMWEEENVAGYFLRVDEVVNSLKGLGENIEDKIVVLKILRSLPLRFDAKVSTIEKMAKLDKLTIDKLHGILIAYETRTNVETYLKRETIFKASKTVKEKEHVSYESSEEESDCEAAHFVHKLKRGSGKYKGKLPLKCFNYGKIGHFASKCPYEKEEDKSNEKESKYKNKKYVRKGKKSLNFKRSFYSKEESSSPNASEEESLNDEINFMAFEDNLLENQEEEDFFDKEEVEVDLEQELISSLNEIKKLRKKNQNLKLLLQEEGNKTTEKSLALEVAKKMIADLNVQIA